MTSSSGRVTGSLRRINWSMRVKIAVLAPIPSASDRIATIEKTGLRSRPRTARRKSDEVALIETLDAAGRWMVYSPGRQRVMSSHLGEHGFLDRAGDRLRFPDDVERDVGGGGPGRIVVRD